MAHEKMKIYCETSFWSWLVSRPSTNPDHAVKQAWTRKWWEEIAPKCDVYVSGYVVEEASRGDQSESDKRLDAIMKCLVLDGATAEVKSLASKLIEFHAVPEKEVADAYHIATAAVYGMDVLLTWNCRHMANLHALPRTAAVLGKAGYFCPKILTPKDAMEE